MKFDGNEKPNDEWGRSQESKELRSYVRKDSRSHFSCNKLPGCLVAWLPVYQIILFRQLDPQDIGLELLKGPNQPEVRRLRIRKEGLGLTMRCVLLCHRTDVNGPAV